MKRIFIGLTLLLAMSTAAVICPYVAGRIILVALVWLLALAVGRETERYERTVSDFDQNYLRLLQKHGRLRTYDIWQLLEEHYGKEIVLGKIHTTADKLERAGLVRTSIQNTPGREKPNRIVALTEMGEAYVSQLEPMSI